MSHFDAGDLELRERLLHGLVASTPVGILVAAALLASLVPARRASRIDPLCGRRGRSNR